MHPCGHHWLNRPQVNLIADCRRIGSSPGQHACGCGCVLSVQPTASQIGVCLQRIVPRGHFTTILKQMRRQATVKNAAYTEISLS